MGRTLCRVLVVLLEMLLRGGGSAAASGGSPEQMLRSTADQARQAVEHMLTRSPERTANCPRLPPIVPASRMTALAPATADDLAGPPEAPVSATITNQAKAIAADAGRPIGTRRPLTTPENRRQLWGNNPCQGIAPGFASGLIGSIEARAKMA